jgi:hypothetical protein
VGFTAAADDLNAGVPLDLCDYVHGVPLADVCLPDYVPLLPPGRGQEHGYVDKSENELQTD